MEPDFSVYQGWFNFQARLHFGRQEAIDLIKRSEGLLVFAVRDKENENEHMFRMPMVTSIMTNLRLRKSWVWAQHIERRFLP